MKGKMLASFITLSLVGLFSTVSFASDFDMSPTIDETVIYDADGVKITVSELYYTDDEVKIETIFENNTDEQLSFISGSMGYSANEINGYIIPDGYVNVDVTPGKQAKELISFGYDILSVYGIKEIADVNLGIYTTNEDSDTNYLDCATVRTDAFNSYDFETDTYKEALKEGYLENVYNCSIDYYAEEELYNQNDVRIISEALITTSENDKGILIEVQNDSDKQVRIPQSNIRVNGLLIQPGTWNTFFLKPEARCVIDLSLTDMWNAMFFEKFGITDIASCTIEFVIKDMEGNEISPTQDVSIINPEVDGKLDLSGDILYESNDIKIISKGFMQDPSEYSNQLHTIMAVENNSDLNIIISNDMDSCSVNGTMIDVGYFTTIIPAKTVGVVDAYLYEDRIKEIGINNINDIENMELNLSIEDENYDLIDETTINIIQSSATSESSESES